MVFEEKTNALFERAIAMESEEGTKVVSYSIDNNDKKDFSSFALKKFAIMLSVLFALCGAGVIVSVFLDMEILVEICAICAVLIFFVGLFAFLSIKGKRNANDNCVNEVKLAFNAKGITLRSCSEIDYAVYAYEWREFDSITEYRSMAVGIVSGLAFIFPKRAFTQEEFDIFKRFAGSALGKKCAFKNFKQ